jgi:glycosyltransferase involved in cell wall biosynthesis
VNIGKKIIISPSGNLYGSENVLNDYLANSGIAFDYVFVPLNSKFHVKLNDAGYRTIGFSKIHFLYLKLIFILILKKVHVVYCNESGHSRYINILARLFRRTIFVLHVRIFEDTMRVNNHLENIRIIAVSQAIKREILINSNLIYDGYVFSYLLDWRIPHGELIKVGIVGRVTKSKGIDLFTLDFLKSLSANYELHFYGDIDLEYKQTVNFEGLCKSGNVKFHGFMSDRLAIYSEIDILLHVNQNEPLGRIFFESLDFGVPFIGFNAGGIAEIGQIIDYPYIVSPDDLPNYFDKISSAKLIIDKHLLELSRVKAVELFSINKYSNKLDSLLS